MKLKELAVVLSPYNRITLTIYKQNYNDEYVFENIPMKLIKNEKWEEYFEYKIKYIYANYNGEIVIVLKEMK